METVWSEFKPVLGKLIDQADEKRWRPDFAPLSELYSRDEQVALGRLEGARFSFGGTAERSND